MPDEYRLDARFPVGTIGELGVLDLVVSTPREVHATAVRTSRYFLWTTLLFGGVLSFVVLRFMERRLLQPLESASQGLVRIGRSATCPARLMPARHDDEFGRLVAAPTRCSRSWRASTGRRPNAMRPCAPTGSSPSSWQR